MAGENKETIEAAKALSALGAAKGGLARAKNMTAEQRSESARAAVQARWLKAGKEPMRQATHVGELIIGNAKIKCAVLNDGIRILNQADFMRAIGRARSPKAGTGVLSTVDDLPFFLQAEALKPFITEELRESTRPIFYLTQSGQAVGYDAQLLIQVCETYLKLRDESLKQTGKIPGRYKKIIPVCDALMRSLAGVAIVALVDEATGYQYERPRRQLEEYLAKFLSESLRRWVRTFPGDYFKHLCRLKNVQFRPDMKLPQYFGHITNDLVWKRIAPGLLKALKERRSERGSPSNKLHSWTSNDLGRPELLLHLGTVVGLMKIHTDFDKFHAQLDKIAPVYPDDPTLFDDPRDWDIPK
jgi:hypothetical protein